MEEIKSHDLLLVEKQNYLKLLRDAFPNGLIEENVGETGWYGWDITPKSRMTISFEVMVRDPYYLRIKKYIGADVCRIFEGSIPADKDMEPDYDFIEKLLKNYDKIGLW